MNSDDGVRQKTGSTHGMTLSLSAAVFTLAAATLVIVTATVGPVWVYWWFSITPWTLVLVATLALWCWIGYQILRFALSRGT
jgi:hypothetical protein